MTINESIERQARSLADYNRQADPLVSNVYWFPHGNEVRLVIARLEIPASVGDDMIHPFYYYPTSDKPLEAASAIALISDRDSRKLRLPPEWGTWQDALKI